MIHQQKWNIKKRKINNAENIVYRLQKESCVFLLGQDLNNL